MRGGAGGRALDPPGALRRRRAPPHRHVRHEAETEAACRRHEALQHERLRPQSARPQPTRPLPGGARRPRGRRRSRFARSTGVGQRRPRARRAVARDARPAAAAAGTWSWCSRCGRGPHASPNNHKFRRLSIHAFTSVGTSVSSVPGMEASAVAVAVAGVVSGDPNATSRRAALDCRRHHGRRHHGRQCRACAARHCRRARVIGLALFGPSLLPANPTPPLGGHGACDSTEALRDARHP